MLEKAKDPRSPLHLLIISNTHTPVSVSGADRDWINLLNALGPDRVRVTWAGERGTDRLRETLDGRLPPRFVDLESLPFYELFHDAMYRRRSTSRWARIIGSHLKGLRRPLAKLRKALGADRPDVVVTITSASLAGAAYAKLARLPHVWCVKEYLDPEVSACRRFARLIEKLSDAVVVPSEAMAKVFGTHVKVLPDGSDLLAIRAGAARASREQVLRSLNLPLEQPVVAQSGALSWAKGQSVTASAWALLAAESASPCSLLFLGPGSPKEQLELLRPLENAPRRWSEWIRFVEFSPGDFSYLAAADIVVHPSVFPDPYPNAVREAMILGKPVVGSRVGGIPELIADGETGLLVQPNNPAELALAVRRLADSATHRTRMGEAARRFAEEHFDIERCKDAFHKLLLEVR